MEDGIPGRLQHHIRGVARKVAAMEGGLVGFRGGITAGM